ncbi:MAG: outer membrane protein assembly factor BamD [candidate division KSB1 bacterium]|nr:outer membrane protein assembly factor BamD [candidate division KSB1 bacterium]
MKIRKVGIILIIFMIGLFSCSKYNIKDGTPLDKRMEIAMKMFENGDYFEAKTQFRIITLSHSGNQNADKAQFYLAECHYNMKEYILAANEYERLTKVFPASEYVDDAKFKLGMSYYQLSPHYGLDQTYTEKSIEHFQEFLEDYHTSDLVEKVERNLLDARSKLAHKVYSSGRIYRKMGRYRAANIYFNKVLEEYYDSKWAPRALYWIGECNRRMHKPKQAIEAFAEFKQKYSHHEWIGRTNDALRELRKELEN